MIILPYQNTPGGFLMLICKGNSGTWDQRQVLNHVAVNIPVCQAIANAANAGESDDQAKKSVFLNSNSDKRIVIFGQHMIPKLSLLITTMVRNVYTLTPGHGFPIL